VDQVAAASYRGDEILSAPYVTLDPIDGCQGVSGDSVRCMGESTDTVPRGDEFARDVGADEAARAGYEDEVAWHAFTLLAAIALTLLTSS